MKAKIFLCIALIASMMLTSCYVTRTPVGQYREDLREQKQDRYTYSKGKQAYLLWGLVRLGHNTQNTPADGNCEISTRHNLLDMVVTTLTGGLFSMQTIKVKATRETVRSATYQSNIESARGGKNRPSENTPELLIEE